MTRACFPEKLTFEQRPEGGAPCHKMLFYNNARKDWNNSFNRCRSINLEAAHNLLTYLNIVLERSGNITKSRRVKNQIL